MTHPEELLAGYVDGTSSAQDRAVVDAHLTTCDRCRREVAEARAAVAALGRLPEAPSPSDLGAKAMAELGTGGGVRGTSAPRWQRWAAPAAVAAAILLVATLVLPKIGGGGASPADRASAGAATAASATATLELSSENFQPDTLAALASDAAVKLTGGAAGVQPEASGAPARTAAPGAAAGVATQDPVLRAKFQGRPAYIGFYAESPGVGQPVAALTVRVASVQGCEILHITQVST